MINELKWRFPNGQGGQMSGMTTGDKEIFRKSLYKSLAREILQNSIDVCNDDSEPVKVEFKTFNMKTSLIPDIEGLKEQVLRCKDFFNYDDNVQEKYKEIYSILNQDEIECLRISDFNTTGLLGVNSNEINQNNFKALVKGTGISIKASSNAGGSKGVGKNAAIVLSNLSCVWYNTLTKDNEFGSIGKADFISGYIKGHEGDNNYYTQGTGYCSDSDQNNAVNEILSLDPSYERDSCGTDIYILGFRKDSEWDIEVIQSIIDSFIVAIYRKKLEVIVNDIYINSFTLKNIVNDRSLMKVESTYKSSLSTYKILSNEDNNVKEYDLTIGDLGSADLLVMPLKKDQEFYASKKCDIVRWPYMKIKDCSKISYHKFSALCLINDNSLGSYLRGIENPEHNNWEPDLSSNQINKTRAKVVLKQLYNQIEELINNALDVTTEGIIDPNKAGEYLQAVEIKGNNKSLDNTIMDGVNDSHESFASKLRRNKVTMPSSAFDDEKGDSLTPEIGGINKDEEEGVVFPDGHNGGNGGDPRPGQETGGLKENDDLIVLANSNKSPIRYKFIAVNPNIGQYKITFYSPRTSEECYLKLFILDESNNKEQVEIKTLKCCGKMIEIKDNTMVGPFKIKLNEKCILEIETLTQKGNFGSEVKVLCK